MSPPAKLSVAHALAALNIDVIEAGFAAASPTDASAIHAIATEVTGPVISSLARAHAADIDAALKALQHAARRRIHVFIGTSRLHREAKLKLSQTQILDRVTKVVGHAAASGAEVQFSAEDATRTEIEFLVDVFQAAADAGATVLNAPDTVGYALPEEMRALFEMLIERVRCPDATFSAHCHDDLGLAVANSLAAISGGAGQVECTINGIGERAGNCALEEVVMALNVRQPATRVTTGVETTRLFDTSGIVANACRHPVPPNKAVVGKNAFAHEAGIHQHGVLSDSRTYEIMRAADVGQTSCLVLGRHSGKHALAVVARGLGIECNHEMLDQAFARFKLGVTDQPVSDDQVRALFQRVADTGPVQPEAQQ